MHCIDKLFTGKAAILLLFLHISVQKSKVNLAELQAHCRPSSNSLQSCRGLQRSPPTEQFTAAAKIQYKVDTLRCYWMFCTTLSFLWAELGFWLFLLGKQPEMCYEEACCRPGQESCYPWNMIDVCRVNMGQLLQK